MEPPSFPAENLGTGSAATLCGISRAALHRFSLGGRIRAKQVRNFRKVGPEGWFPASELEESCCSVRCFGSECFHSKPSLLSGPVWVRVAPQAFSPWFGDVLGCLGEFPGGAAPVPMLSPAAESSSPPALALRLAPRPAAFHCRLFIRLNSLRFLSCSLRGTEGELVPADGPHPPHPAPLERGLEKRDAGEGGISHPCRAPAPLPSKYGKRSA